MNKNLLLCSILHVTAFSLSASASEDYRIIITAEITIPPCTINNNSPINISFGKMANFKIDGKNYAQAKTVNIECHYYNGTPYIAVIGSALNGAPSNILQASAGANTGKLGIALYQGGNVNNSYPLYIGAGTQGKFGYQLNTGFSGSGSSRQFTFTSVPYVIGNNRDLTGATFTASATMNIDYL